MSVHRYTFKVILSFLFFLFSLLAITGFGHAAQVTLVWDAIDPIPDGYNVYQRSEGNSFNYSTPVWSGSSTTCTLSDLVAGTTQYFVVRAFFGTEEKLDSNEVSFQVIEQTPVTYTITASAGANGTISPSGAVSLTAGGSQSYNISANTGYHVANVLVDGVSVGAVTSYAFSNVSADHTISATFTADSYTITASAGSNGTISPSGATSVTYGGSQTYTIGANIGYHVSNVVVDGVSVGAVSSYTFSNVSAGHTISATFAINSYTISASAGSNGTISPSGTTSVAYGGSQTYTISASTGYAIADVLVDNASVGSVATYTFSQVSGNHTITVSFQSTNQAPAADAGPDQTVDEAELVTLNGQNSIDLDDGIAAFQWRQVQGPTVDLSNAGEPEAAFTAPNVDEQGEVLEFELTVTDYSGVTATDRCIVNVTWVNLAPTAETGADQTTQSGTQVVLDATQSVDPDGGVLFYQWTQRQGPTVTLSDSQAAQPRFTAPEVGVQGASLIFDLTVTDEGGLQDTDSCVVTITWVNAPPVADAGSDQTVMEADVVTLSGAGSIDPDDGIRTYLWKQTEGTPVTLSDTTAMNPVFTAPEVGADGMTLRFQLMVTDNNGLQSTDECRVNVQDSEAAPSGDTTPPTVTIVDPAQSQVEVKTPKITIRGTARDDQQLDRVEWSNEYGDNGLADGTSEWVLLNLKLRRGMNTITITAYDTAGNHGSAVIEVYAGLRR